MTDHEENRRAWDSLAAQKQRFTRPVDDRELARALDHLRTSGWLANLRGKRLLCLAAGGGRQGPLYAMAGAEVTIVDVSARQLELDRQVAAERGLCVRTIETSMDDLSMFSAAEFQVVIHPVSTCYVRQVQRVFQAVARVIESGGVYFSQHKQPASLQADVAPSARGYALTEPYYRQGPLPAVTGSLHREAGTQEYLHRWEELVGGMCRAGFVVEDLVEPLHAEHAAPVGTFAHRSCFVAPYVSIKARRKGRESVPAPSQFWMPPY